MSTHEPGDQTGDKNAFEGGIRAMTTRKPGGQPSNHNALKNGIYAQFITLADDIDMDGMPDDNLNNELNLARLNLTKALTEKDSAKTTKEKLAWDFASHYWLDTVIHIKIKNMERKQTVVEVWDSYIDAIRAANDKQVIKR
ncbi:MAG: hypothetical protein WC832_09740 [Anaerolineales bacterium]